MVNKVGISIIFQDIDETRKSDYCVTEPYEEPEALYHPTLEW